MANVPSVSVTASNLSQASRIPPDVAHAMKRDELFAELRQANSRAKAANAVLDALIRPFEISKDENGGMSDAEKLKVSNDFANAAAAKMGADKALDAALLAQRIFTHGGVETPVASTRAASIVTVTSTGGIEAVLAANSACAKKGEELSPMWYRLLSAMHTTKTTSSDVIVAHLRSIVTDMDPIVAEFVALHLNHIVLVEATLLDAGLSAETSEMFRLEGFMLYTAARYAEPTAKGKDKFYYGLQSLKNYATLEREQRAAIPLVENKSITELQRIPPAGKVSSAAQSAYRVPK